MKMCSPHVREVLPANMAPQLKQILLPTSTVPNMACQKASSLPGLVWSYITVMFLQNVKF